MQAIMETGLRARVVEQPVVFHPVSHQDKYWIEALLHGRLSCNQALSALSLATTRAANQERRGRQSDPDCLHSTDRRARSHSAS